MKRHILSALVFISTLSISAAHAEGQAVEQLLGWDKIIGPPPARGSQKEADDVAYLLELQSKRTEADCKWAAKQAKMSLKNFFGGPGGPLSDKEVKKNWFFWYKYIVIGGLPSLFSKHHYKRPRPFKSFPEITPCIGRPSSASYPSGHTSTAWVMARALARKYPERAELFYRRGNDVAYSRMLGGVHYPSDVEAGRKLANYFIDRLFSDKKAMNMLLSN